MGVEEYDTLRESNQVLRFLFENGKGDFSYDIDSFLGTYRDIIAAEFTDKEPPEKFEEELDHWVGYVGGEDLGNSNLHHDPVSDKEVYHLITDFAEDLSKEQDIITATAVGGVPLAALISDLTDTDMAYVEPLDTGCRSRSLKFKIDYDFSENDVLVVEDHVNTGRAARRTVEEVEGDNPSKLDLLYFDRNQPRYVNDKDLSNLRSPENSLKGAKVGYFTKSDKVGLDIYFPEVVDNFDFE